jgi:purine-binding chemotaxis protein CheW
VINLRVRFGFERIPRDLRTRLLVVQDGERRVGLMADAAREFLRIADDAIRPPHEALGGLSGDYLGGVATLGERVVLILDVHGVVDTAAVETA